MTLAQGMGGKPPLVDPYKDSYIYQFRLLSRRLLLTWRLLSLICSDWYSYLQDVPSQLTCSLKHKGTHHKSSSLHLFGNSIPNDLWIWWCNDLLSWTRLILKILGVLAGPNRSPKINHLDSGPNLIQYRTLLKKSNKRTPEMPSSTWKTLVIVTLSL